MLQKTQVVDSVTVDINGVLSLREVTLIMEDGVAISSSYHRSTLAPGADLADQDARVVAIANAVWTPEVIQAYQDRLAGEG
jgi:hypothetical protein